MQRQWQDLAWALTLMMAVVVSGLFVSFNLNQALLVIPVGAFSALAGRRMRSVRPAILAFTMATAVALTVVVVRDPGNVLSDALTLSLHVFALAVLPWWAGSYRRLRLDQREREQRIIAAQARTRERATIAQDMHDSLGHELALIALSSGALELSPELGEHHRATVAELRARAVAASDQLHDIVGVLRADEEPGARDLRNESWEDLVQRARESGLQVRLERVGPTPGLPGLSPPSVRAGHRVIQEALTNVVKHAPSSRVHVLIDETSDPVIIKISNSRSPSDHGLLPSGGQGLTGLEERLRLIGGTLQAGAGNDGFTVLVRFPRQSGGGVTAARPPAGEPASTTAGEKAHNRKRFREVSALPAALAVGLAVMLFVLHSITVTQTALSSDDYTRLKTGQTRAEVTSLLPSHTQSGPPPILEVPAVPVGSRCEHYQARDNIFDVSQDMYRLCFRDDRLITKDHLVPEEQ